MKKVVAVLVIIMLLSGSNIEAQANSEKEILISNEFCADVLSEIAGTRSLSKETGLKINLRDSFYLYNFIDEPIAIFYKLDPVGYAIYDYVGTTVLEYSVEYDHKYYVDSTVRYYYEGVLNYFQKTRAGYMDLINGQIKEIKEDYHFTSEDFYHNSEYNSIERSADPETYLENDIRYYDCNIEEHFEHYFPNLSEEDIAECPGVCGSLACAILVAYYDDYCSELAGNGDFANDMYKTYGEGVDGYYGKYLVQTIVSYVEPSGNGSVLLNIGMSNYLENQGIEGTVKMGALAVYQQTKYAIDNGVPIIVGTTDHYSVGIGYRNISEKQMYIYEGRGGNAIWVNSRTIIDTWIMELY